MNLHVRRRWHAKACEPKPEPTTLRVTTMPPPVPVDTLGAAVDLARKPTPSGRAFLALLLGLYDGSAWPLDLGRILAALDEPNRALVGALLHEYAYTGETEDLRRAVRRLARASIELPPAAPRGATAIA